MSSHGCFILGALPRDLDDNDDGHGNRSIFMKASAAAFFHGRVSIFHAKAKAGSNPSRNLMAHL